MILVTGGNGQLGKEVTELLKEKGIDFISVNSSQLDVTDFDCVVDFINKHKPSVIFHCAAYTAVDKAEDDGYFRNREVNVDGSRNISIAAENVNAKLIYISTDYVFDGKKTDQEYGITDVTNPMNEYGKAKLCGEQEVLSHSSKSYIIRTSWVFGKYGNNFVYTMKRLAKNNSKLTVVDDQYGRPTWTRSLSEFMLYLIENDCHYGTYHFSNTGKCSWYEFAQEILKEEKIIVENISSEKYPQKAERPKNSVLDISSATNTGFKIPSWQEALHSMMDSLDY